jgi:DNA-binding transcriptional regulator YhcF (GntR family)
MSEPDSPPHGAQRELRASDIEQLLEGQIREGRYAEGTRLPTVRELAQQFKVDKNTAARAYRGLERRGFIDLARGRGAFVRPLPAESESDWRQRAEQLVRDGRRLGRSRAALREALESYIDRVYGAGEPRLLFVECNRSDMEALGGELSLSVDAPLDLALLDEVLRNPVAQLANYDLVVTTFQHLGQVRQAALAHAHKQIVGVHATPSHDTLLKLAQLHVPNFGLVCDSPSTIESLTHMIYTYNPAATVLPALIDDEAQLRATIAQADAIVVTRSCHDRLEKLGLPQQLITVVFTIDQQSIDFLRRRIQELRHIAE